MDIWKSGFLFVVVVEKFGRQETGRDLKNYRFWNKLFATQVKILVRERKMCVPIKIEYEKSPSSVSVRRL
jgi:hypothetical protein